MRSYYAYPLLGIVGFYFDKNQLSAPPEVSGVKEENQHNLIGIKADNPFFFH